VKSAADVFPVINELHIAVALQAGIPVLLMEECGRADLFALRQENVGDCFPQWKEQNKRKYLEGL
jgi:hypothetical protein